MLWSTAVAKHTTSAGLEYCLQEIVRRFRTWPPTMVEVLLLADEFNYKNLGIPDFEVAFGSATIERGRLGYQKWAAGAHWSVLKTVQNIDTWNFDRLPAEEAKKVFQREWQKVISSHSNNLLEN